MAQAGPSTRSKVYNIKPGVALIINQLHFAGAADDRRGANVDTESLDRLFKLMDYEVCKEEDCPWDNLEECLARAVKLFNDTRDGPFFLCIMTHGYSEKFCLLCKQETDRCYCGSHSHTSTTSLLFPDNKVASTDSIRRLFREPKINLKLKGRPKVVLIQACRGSEAMTQHPDGSQLFVPTDDFMVDVHQGSRDPDADVLVFQSCLQDRPAFRSERSGSFFINEFCAAVLRGLMKDPDSCHLKTVLTEVKREMHDPKHIRGRKVFMTPEVTSDILLKDFILRLFGEKRKQYKAMLHAEYTRIENLRQRMLGDRANMQADQRATGPEAPAACDCAVSDSGPCQGPCQGPCSPEDSDCPCRGRRTLCGPRCHSRRRQGRQGAVECENTETRCGCQKGSCVDKKCACRKRDFFCHERCHPGSATCCNYEREPRPMAAAKAKHVVISDASSAASPSRLPGAAAASPAMRPARHHCGCKTACEYGRCGCKKQGLDCDELCHPSRSSPCRDASPAPDVAEKKKVRPAKADGKSPQASSPKTEKAVVHLQLETPTGRSRPRLPATSSDANKTSRYHCRCSKTSCESDSKCGCRKQGLRCDQWCHPAGPLGCRNREEEDDDAMMVRKMAAVSLSRVG